MSVQTFQGTIENGQIRLATDVRLPAKTVVYVVVPDAETPTEPVAARTKINLAELATRMPKDYTPQEENFGAPVGREEW